MAKFFVGQRVRLVVTKTEFNRGREGSIIAVGHWGHRDILPCGLPLADKVHCDLYVCWDSVVEAGGEFYKNGPIESYRVEPILPEGAQPLGYSFEQMMSEFRIAEAVK